MIDFTDDSVCFEMDRLVKGKVIKEICLDRGYDDYFVIKFTDGSKLRMRYDWIYEWELV